MEAKESLYKLVTAMLEAQSPIPRQILIEFLTGKESDEISEMKLDEMEAFGIGDSHDEEFWANIIDAAYERGYLKEKSTRNDALTLTAEGKKFHKKPVSFIISDEEEESSVPDTESNLDDIINIASTGRTPVKKNITSGHTQQFINLIRAIDRKIDLDEYAETNSIPFADVLDSLEEIVKQGRQVEITYFTDEVIGEDGINELSESFDEYGTDNLDLVEKEFGDVYSEEEIRLARIVYWVKHIE
ncbi:MAG: RQC domain-containing protein [Bacteroidaceae bacterium]